jgi:hypothetical protein
MTDRFAESALAVAEEAADDADGAGDEADGGVDGNATTEND